MGICQSNTYKPEIKPPNSAKSIYIEDLQKYPKEMQNVCKIETKRGKGTGFLCYIPFPDKIHLLPVLITNNHILNEEDISIGKKINFSINNEEKFYEIIIDDSRKTFTKKPPYDITIVELKPNDKLDLDSLFEIDYELIKNNMKIKKNFQIYMLHYPNGKSSKVSWGTIQNQTAENILHLCATEPGSSGAPIFNTENRKIIGIHKGSHLAGDKNVGTFLKGPLEEFLKKNNFKNILNNSNKQNKNELSINNNTNKKNHYIQNEIFNEKNSSANSSRKNKQKEEYNSKKRKENKKNDVENNHKKKKRRHENDLKKVLPIINPFIDDETKKLLAGLGRL